MSTGSAKKGPSSLASAPSGGVVSLRRAGSDLPPLPAPNVERCKLAERLLGLEQRSAACILLAPAGFGKTTLLAQLAHRTRQSGQRTAWLTLTPEHAHPERLAAALAAAFGLESPAAGSSVSALSERLEAQAPSLLFLDELEVLTDTPAMLSIVQLIERLQRCRLFIAGRTSGNIKLSRLTLAGQVQLIAASDLVFSAEDIQTLSPALTADDATTIAQRTEGWPVAALATVRERNSAADTDGDRVPVILARYIEENLLADLDSESLRILMEAAVFERLSVALLTDLPGRTYPCVDLAQLTTRNIPIQCDAQLEWYRFYLPFRSLLRQRLRRLDPPRWQRLQRYATDWFERHGYPAEAVRHAAHCADPEVTAGVMERAGAIRLSLHQGFSVLRVSQQLRLTEATDYPLLTLGQIYLKAQDGRVEEARAHFERLRASTRSFETLLTGERAQDVRNFLDLLEIVLGFYEDREVDAALIERLERHLIEVVDKDPAMVATVASLLSPAYRDVGRIEDACNMADIGLASLRGTRADYIAFYLELQQTSSTLALGRIKEAALHVDRAQTLAYQSFGPHSFAEGILSVLRGIVRYENNELEPAERLLSGALHRDVLINGWFDLYAEGFSAAAETAAVLHDASAVDAILAEADTIAAQRRLPRLTFLVALLRMSAATTAGNLPYAMNLMHGPTIAGLLQSAPEPVSPWNSKLRTLALLQSARLLNRLGRPRDAASRLSSIDRHYVQAGDARVRFTYQALAMEVTFQLRRHEETAAYFSEALNLALESGFVRRLLNCREQILEVFDWMMASGRPISSRIISFCDSALRTAANDDSRLDMHKRLLPRRRTAPPAGSNLTPRETEILAFIAEGLSTKEIAHRISVTTSTVKTHRRNVFEKLGVRRRSQAIARAREKMII